MLFFPAVVRITLIKSVNHKKIKSTNISLQSVTLIAVSLFAHGVCHGIPAHWRPDQDDQERTLKNSLMYLSRIV